jgi:hypothetical protein
MNLLPTMKKLLSLLLAFVFLNVQSQAFFPSYGGLGLNPVGTYGGTLVPSSSTGTSSNGVSSAISIGLFSIGVPQVGLATGTFALFIQGGAYVGDIIGYVDPTTEGFSAILSGKSTFTVAIPFAVTVNNVTTITFNDESIAATGNMEATFSQGSLTSGVGNTTLLQGTATVISFLAINADGSPAPTATQQFIVSGVQQASGTVQPSTITLQNSGSSGGNSSS